MIAKQLALILTQLCNASDVTTDTIVEMDQRFESLRGYGRIPRGRENRGRPLTDQQIVAAILGLVASRPTWAGHATAIIERLKPVGGKSEALGGPGTLTEALINILVDKMVQESIVSVRISLAEAGTNSHGQATITHVLDNQRHQMSFVRDEAVSLLQRGAEKVFDAELRNSPVSRELVFNQQFFWELSQEIAFARAYPAQLIGDGYEYDKEDAEIERRKQLGVTRSSNFLHVGVDNMVTWPREERLVIVGPYKFVLMPKTKSDVQSVHVDLHANRLSLEDAMTAVNRFLSLLTWCDDQFAVVQGGWSGSPIPIAVPKRNLAFATAHHWIFERQLPEAEEVNRALALYREARNAEQNSMKSYAVLNYYKIIEIRYPNGAETRQWFRENFPVIRDDPRDQYGIDKFLEACGEEAPDKYIYRACRVAVAHASPKYRSDPDDTHELRRLDNAAGVLRRLARHFIQVDLNFSDSRFVQP